MAPNLREGIENETASATSEVAARVKSEELPIATALSVDTSMGVGDGNNAEAVASDSVVSTPSSAALTPQRRKRDVVKQVSMRVYLKGVDLASDVIRGVFLQRMEEAEDASKAPEDQRSLDMQISESRKTRKHLWRPQTKDDSVLMGSSKASLSELVAKKEMKDVNEFFLSRVTDPTSYFYRFRFDDVRHLMPQKAEVQLVDITWLKPHEQIVSMERVAGLKKATISWDAYTEPLLVDVKTGAILDGHHRYTVGQQLRLKQLPAVLVDYLGDSTITVDVWPGCGRTTLTKEEVIEMSLSPNVFPPKTSRHRFTESLPPISIPLMILRQNPTPIIDMTLPPSPKNEPVDLFAVPRLRRRTSLREVSFNLICGAQSLATSVTKSIFRTRLRKIDENDRTQLDVVKRRSPDSSDFFNVIRNNDPTSAFCKQTSATFEDLLSSDASVRKKFFLTRICDPTSYFYKYHFDAPAKREPKRAAIKLASIKWLKAHEHVVSWDRVDGLRRATVSWNAYLEPLLVDVATGAILDGHHRYNVGLQLELQTVPVVFVDYLNDDSITVDVWPDCGRDSLTKEEVIEMSLSDELFPPKTSRHKFSDDLPPISVPLDRLRQPIESNYVDL